MNSFSKNPALRFFHNHFCRCPTHLEPGPRFLDLTGLLFEPDCEHLYLLLLLRDRGLQLLNFEIEHGLPGGVRNGLGRDALGRKAARVGSIRGERAQSSIGIDHHYSRRRGGNRRTGDVVDGAPVTDLTKNAVHPGVVADDNIVIGGGNTRPGHSAYAHVFIRSFIVLERLIADSCVVVSAGVDGERTRTDGRVGAAVGVVHERKVTGGSVGRTAVVKDKRVSSNGRVVCAGGVEQKRYSADRRIGIAVVEDQCPGAYTGVEAAGGIQKERLPTERCICSTSGEGIKCIASLRCREIGITRVRGRGWCRRGRGSRCRCRGCGWILYADHAHHVAASAMRRAVIRKIAGTVEGTTKSSSLVANPGIPNSVGCPRNT